MRFCDTEGFEFFGGLSFHDTERSEILGGLSYHDTESEAPFTLRKIFGTGSDKNEAPLGGGGLSIPYPINFWAKYPVSG